MSDEKMRTAVCWELKCNGSRGIDGYRVIVVDRFLLVQELSETNARPRWTVTGTDSPAEAGRRAVGTTEFVEQEYGGKIAVAPTEIVIHDAELASLSHNGTIPPALRARVFTSLYRGRAT